WSGLPPSCVYVDCGAPPPPPAHGTVSLPAQATHFNSVAEYGCETGYRRAGLQRRICQSDGTWSGATPTCTEVACGELERPDATLSVVTSGHRVGDTAQYRCGLGRRTVGDSVRTCQNNGEWSGTTPSCQWVDCGPVPAVENGRLYLVNQSTEYDSLVEHHCFPGHERRGPFRRRCTETGRWSGETTTCVLKNQTSAVPPPAGAAVGLETSQTEGAAGRIHLHTTMKLLPSASTFSNIPLPHGRRREVMKQESAHGMKTLAVRSGPVTSLPGYSSPVDGQPTALQARPLPSRPDEEAIYAEADSFSSGPDSFTSDVPERTYANQDATYVNGLQHSGYGNKLGGPGDVYQNGAGDAGATYHNGVRVTGSEEST
ncbi:sushi, von Willebrand factor type A, EGF and pentraxin domain-containing protein 1-like, partial [Pollicipes pollicipes]|uniref:sushi, von Willebrand factor type A, EGF and pentraxin domain-containing protein 1-like n=1 Tax=Pollicipes pollicipes TaxID=41117 RepID=UPI001884CD97